MTGEEMGGGELLRGTERTWLLKISGVKRGEYNSEDLQLLLLPLFSQPNT